MLTHDLINTSLSTYTFKDLNDLYPRSKGDGSDQPQPYTQ